MHTLSTFNLLATQWATLLGPERIKHTHTHTPNPLQTHSYLFALARVTKGNGQGKAKFKCTENYARVTALRCRSVCASKQALRFTEIYTKSTQLLTPSAWRIYMPRACTCTHTRSGLRATKLVRRRDKAKLVNCNTTHTTKYSRVATKTPKNNNGNQAEATKLTLHMLSDGWPFWVFRGPIWCGCRVYYFY